MAGASSVAAAPGAAGSPHESSQQAAADHDAGEGHADEEHHEEGLTPLLGRLFNFAVLAGALVYFLRKPLVDYLESRRRQIRGELESAAAMEATAKQQMAEINAKLERLPAELDALRARGRQEIAAEEARIRAEAEAERRRLLEQTRREIDLHVRLARRELVEHAADLAVSVARERIQRNLTDADQRRLVERYLMEVRRDG